jgi:hypothetical protein
MPTTLSNIAAGNRYAFGGFVNSFGFMIGAAASAPAAGTSSGMFQVKGIKTAAPASPEPEAVPVSGDDELLGEFQFDSITERRFTAEFSVGNLTQEAALQGTNVQTLGEISVGALDVLEGLEFDTCWIFQSRAKKQDTGVRGQKAWQGTIVPLATAKPLGRAAYEERTAALYRFSISPQVAGYHPWGLTVLDANAGTPGMRFLPFQSEYPVHIQAFTGNAALAVIPVDFEPISVAKTTAFVNRVAATVLSVSAANKTVTLSATPAGAANVVIIYEFNAN